MTSGPQTTPAPIGPNVEPNADAPDATTPADPTALPSQRNVKGDLRAFLEQLLRLQCETARAAAGLVYLAPTEARKPGVAARFARDPQHGPSLLEGPAARALEQVATRALERIERTGELGIQAEHLRLPSARDTFYGSEPAWTVLAAPLAAAGRVEGVSVLVLDTRQAPPTHEAVERVSLTSARFEAFLWEQQCLAEAQQKGMLRETLELLDAAQQAINAHAMAGVLCHELQRRFGATRASVGIERHHRVRVLAVGGSDDPDRRSQAVQLIEDAMDECLAQDAEVLFPAPPELEADPGARRVSRAHEALARHGTPSTVLSLPLRFEGEALGAITLERDAQDPFPPGAVVLLRLVAEYAGPALVTRQLADRGPFRVTRDGVRALGSLVVGPRHTAVKLVLLLILVTLLAAALVPIPSRVAATGEVRAGMSRTISAPFAGYLAIVEAEPGDEIRIGQPLVRMDTSELRLQIAEFEGQRLTAVTERDDANAARELARARLATARIAEIDAQLELLRDRVDRAVIRAPIDGVVARGDLEPFIGALVQPDRPLLELVTPERLVTVRLSERDAARVRPGDAARFTPRATPDVRLPMTIRRVNPAAEIDAGRNIYFAEAEVDPNDPRAAALRPGSTGTVRVHDGRTTALRWLLAPLVDEVRMRLWW
ncbi:MAG: HlyD family efflux transporter periplasmic adaptor subunit [Phycisphaerales bacterium]|nr:MAG: HlyD family efflux transporter periplasmic adaptor subunit [Phycisphaerales bacterium]